MNDRELLDAALRDDGEALRLAVRRGFEIDIDLELKRTVVHTQDMSAGAKEAHGDDPGLATRRAIVRAAAASETIGCHDERLFF
jgi:hypothetical protein